MLLGAGILLVRPESPFARYAKLAAVSVLLGSIFLSLNYFLQSGVPVPWLNAGNSLAEGVDITILIALFSSALLAANLHALTGRSAATARMIRIPVSIEDTDVPA